ncbi:hypothetical protein HMPREF9074_09500 [Capnocytophaga sp. oral taxon 329 str. F0087]|nr:hypothetical protein HMPREF9074_09500 [Capnocytophaga sp. oral taxon 329 str. F0087]
MRKQKSTATSSRITTFGFGKEYDTVVFRNGYARDAPSLTIELKSIRFGTGNPEWGAEANKKYFVLYLGKIINKKNINK